MVKSYKKMCQLKEVFREIYRFEHELKARSGLSLNQALTLCTLSKNETASGILGKELGLSPGRMSKILSSLEDRGFIERSLDKVDKRVMMFSLSLEGEKALAAIDMESLEIPDIMCK